MRARAALIPIPGLYRLRIAAATIPLLALPMLFAPSVALAADYTISDDASCAAFITAIGGTGHIAFGTTCFIESGTLAAGDTLTVTNDWTIRPQGDGIDPNAVDFTNQGTITIDSDGLGTGGFYGAGVFVNAGIFNVNQDYSINFFTIDNTGTFNVNAGGVFHNNNTLNNSGTINIVAGGELSNNGGAIINNAGTINYAGTLDNVGTIPGTPGVLNNACGATVTGTGTYAGPAPVQAACPPTPVASNLPNAAMDTSADTSPLLALGFAALLIGSLGTLAFARTRRR